jgi:Rieske Fe-S protein
MTHSEPKPLPLARRQVLGAGVAGATLLLVPEGCSSSGGGPADASADVGRALDTGGTCPAAEYARSVSISSAGIAKQGTSYEFSDSCYKDPHCGQDRILLIHPLTKDVYVAMSGSCTHKCCDNTGGEGGPTYHPSFVVDGGSTNEAGAADASSEAGTVLEDVLVCSCHGSMFSALDGAVLGGPATEPLQLLSTSESGGNVVVEIPMP